MINSVWYFNIFVCVPLSFYFGYKSNRGAENANKYNRLKNFARYGGLFIFIISSILNSEIEQKMIKKYFDDYSTQELKELAKVKT